MKDDISIRSQVDSEFLDKVEQQCFRILLRQRLLYNERWYSSAFFKRSATILRLLGFIVSGLGIFLCLFYILYPSTCPRWFFTEIYLILFVMGGVFFYYFPRIEARVVARVKLIGSNSCRKMAKRLVAKARKKMPFTADYSVKGDLVTYYRGKGDQWHQAWCRTMRGYAIVGANVVLFFRKQTSIIPTVLILFENNESIVKILEQLEISFSFIENDLMYEE